MTKLLLTFKVGRLVFSEPLVVSTPQAVSLDLQLIHTEIIFLLNFFFLFFWGGGGGALCHMACGILVPRPEIETVPPAVE